MGKKPTPAPSDSTDVATQLRKEFTAKELATAEGRHRAAARVRERREVINTEAHRLRDEAAQLSELLRELEPPIDREERKRRRASGTRFAVLPPPSEQ